MADRSKIEWTEASWNPVRAGDPATLKIGHHCEHVSEGCRNCYAETFNRRLGTGLAYKPGHRADIEIFVDDKTLQQPLRWRRPRMIFVGSMTDLFADFVTDLMLDRIFAIMALCRHHTFQVLTKRPERMRAYLDGYAAHVRIEGLLDTLKPNGNWNGNVLEARRVLSSGRPLPNVWAGTSCEDQPTADARIHELLATPAAIHFVSAEPLLGAIDLTGLKTGGQIVDALSGHRFFPGYDDVRRGASSHGHERLDWIIVGGESGPRARPMHPDWARSIRDQCAAAGVAFFFKQWGEWADMPTSRIISDGPVTDRWGNVRDWMSRYVVFDEDAGAARVRGHSFSDHSTDLVYRVGKKAAGRLLDGVEHNGMPEVRG